MTLIDIMLLTAMVAAASWTVMTRSLLKSTIGLAFTSAIITIIMFRLDSPLAAVFELSVCTGLITAVFVSTISLTKPLTHKEIIKLSKDRAKRFWYLPVIMIIVGVALIYLKLPVDFKMPLKPAQSDVRGVLWNSRPESSE
jgi:NADH-quinone oxidoreductase subunit J